VAEKRASPTEKAPRSDVRHRSFERIIDAAIRTPTLPGSRMQLSVRSSEWGELRIELVVDGSEVRATVRTESDAARDALASQLDDLRARLEDRGLRLGEFHVSVGRPADSAEEGAVAPRSIRRQVLDLVV
jgi:hypothetical protein